ncbi:uncharacterized protein LOC126265409 [Aethina tumida]|uniref:uncharacterized protein LOC126265409 n=1 Tax=Aethina tumida TaxID=116153 RepID=UPI002148E8B0|nr:uncharacterized protein LOC126265409 [Aethina tumida]
MPGNQDLTKLARRARLVPFKQDDPELWFSLVEQMFKLRGIKSDSIKFAIVSLALTQDVLTEIRDIITSTPVDNSYEKLKLQVIKHRLEKEEMEDMKPSEFLRHLRRFASGPSTDEIVRSVWISRLPENYQRVLKDCNDCTLEQLSYVADTLILIIQDIQKNIEELIAKLATPVSDNVCWYHGKFGSEARQCQQPCSYNG